jgi:hypothetical protein
MIYELPSSEQPIDHGDLIDSCPVAMVSDLLAAHESAKIELDFHRVVVLTQTCDLANQRSDSAVVASVFEAQRLVDQKVLKPSDVRGPIRAGRVWGLYFLPACTELDLAEMVIDLRRIHTVRLDLLRVLCQTGKRRGRVKPLYREHLAKHFGDTFSRIGLPEPYNTQPSNPVEPG